MTSSDFLLDPELIFLNHGSFGACPRQVLAVQLALRERLERDPLRFLTTELEGMLDAARREVADFVDAEPEDLAFVNNATTAVNTVLASLRFSPGDELVVTDHGYAACRNAAEFWAARAKARVVEARLPWPVANAEAVVDAIQRALTSRTRLLLIDHVTSPSAIVFPVESIVDQVQARGIPVLIDGAHAPGMLPLSVRRIGAAFYTGNFHKWCCAPKGAAFLAVRPEQRSAIRPLVISHGAADVRTDRSRFWLEFDWLGTYDPTAVLCVPHALHFLNNALPGGLPAVFDRNHRLALHARALLSTELGAKPVAPETMIGSMATVVLPGERWVDPDSLHRRLRDEFKIQVPVFSFPGRSERLLRVCAHLYNTPHHYERLTRVLSAINLESARNRR